MKLGSKYKFTSIYLGNSKMNEMLKEIIIQWTIDQRENFNKSKVIQKLINKEYNKLVKQNKITKKI